MIISSRILDTNDSLKGKPELTIDCVVLGLNKPSILNLYSFFSHSILVLSWFGESDPTSTV